MQGVGLRTLQRPSKERNQHRLIAGPPQLRLQRTRRLTIQETALSRQIQLNHFFRELYRRMQWWNYRNFFDPHWPQRKLGPSQGILARTRRIHRPVNIPELQVTPRIPERTLRGIHRLQRVAKRD